MQFLEDSFLIARLTVLQNTLDHSASIRVSCENVNLTPKCFNDKLNMFSGNTLNSFLNNVITVLIFDALEDVRLEFLDKFSLLVGQDMFESLCVC